MDKTFSKVILIQKYRKRKSVTEGRVVLRYRQIQFLRNHIQGMIFGCMSSIDSSEISRAILNHPNFNVY